MNKATFRHNRTFFPCLAVVVVASVVVAGVVVVDSVGVTADIG